MPIETPPRAPRAAAPHDWGAELRARGLRVTKQRLAVLGALHANQHSTVDEVHVAAMRELPTLTAQAIYLMLDDLIDAGLVRRLDAPRSAARFETRVGDNHHHLLCTSCGRIVDVDCAVGEAPCIHPDNSHGFEIEAADVLYRGRCPQCAKAAQGIDAAQETTPSTTTKQGE